MPAPRQGRDVRLAEAEDRPAAPAESEVITERGARLSDADDATFRLLADQLASAGF